VRFLISHLQLILYSISVNHLLVKCEDNVNSDLFIKIELLLNVAS